MTKLKLKQLSNLGRAYVRATKNPLVMTEIKPHSVESLKTNILIKLPKGTYGCIARHSSLAFRNFIGVGDAINSEFRNNVLVVLFNHLP